MVQPMTTLTAVAQAYAVRPCNVCQQYGECPHREFEVEAALIEAETRRQEQPRRRAGKPLARAPIASAWASARTARRA